MKGSRAKFTISPAEELDHVEVVNRHTYSGPRDNSYVYIGRGTPLGNQYSHTSGTTASYRVESREVAVSKFNDWLAAQIEKGDGPVFRAIQQLKELALRGVPIKLACSCTPEICHGDVVKATIELLVHKERHPEQQLTPKPELQFAQQNAQSRTDAAQPDLAVELIPVPASSARAEQARADILGNTVADDFTALYNVPEGLTRAQHASNLNSVDQFAREAFESGATINEGVLSIPKDPDSRPRDDAKVTIGTEAHAINFVRGFIADPQVAAEKGKLLYELGNKACGQWMDSHGRLAVFTHIYTEIRQDENGAYRSNDEKAAVIDQVLAETARWAEPLPEPVPEPTPEEVHQFTLALAEENRSNAVDLLPDPTEAAVLTESVGSPYVQHLESYGLSGPSSGLATIGELSGFAGLQYDTQSPEGSLEENEIYAEMFEEAVFGIEFATPEGDHLGAEREPGTSITLDATFERISIDALPPQIPDSLSQTTQDELLSNILPSVDAQLENGASKKEILSPIYENNRGAEQRDFHDRVTETFARAGAERIDERPISRMEELNAISSLRILVGAEHRQQTQPFTRSAILWAKENYQVDADRLRAQGRLKVGEYQKIVTAQNEARAEWLKANPGQNVPTRAEIASINKLEQAGHQLNAAIAGINPTPQEHAQVLDQIQSRLLSTKESCETLLQNYQATEQTAQELAAEAIQYAEAVRATPEFQALKSELVNQTRENSIDAREALIRGNNGRFDNYAQNRESALTIDQAQPRTSSELRDQIRPLEEMLSSRGVDTEYLQQQAAKPDGLDLPWMRGIEEHGGRYYPLEPVNGFPSVLAPEEGFATHAEAQRYIDQFSKERDPDEQKLLTLYAEHYQTARAELGQNIQDLHGILKDVGLQSGREIDNVLNVFGLSNPNLYGQERALTETEGRVNGQPGLLTARVYDALAKARGIDTRNIRLEGQEEWQPNLSDTITYGDKATLTDSANCVRAVLSYFGRELPANVPLIEQNGNTPDRAYDDVSRDAQTRGDQQIAPSEELDLSRTPSLEPIEIQPPADGRNLTDSQIEAVIDNYLSTQEDIFEEQNWGAPQSDREIEEAHQEWYQAEIARFEEFDRNESARQQQVETTQQRSNYPELTGEPRTLSPYAEISSANQTSEREARQTLADSLINPQIESAQALNQAQLATYNEAATHLTGISVENAAQARDALTAKLEAIDRATSLIDATRNRFGIQEQPNIDLEVSPSPGYVSLTSDTNVRVPVENIREFNAIQTVAEQCRLETSAWSSPYAPQPISGSDKERTDTARYVSNYIDYRLKDHTTQELAYNPTFRNYSQQLSNARNPEELIQVSQQVKLENYELHQQLVAHRADPTKVAPPDRQPLTVAEMRELFLSTSPASAATRGDRDEMRDILKSMAVFGQEKTERVELLAQGKLEPSPTLAKLLDNLESRQTVRAVNHFYSSLRTPQAELQTKNSFDLQKAHARLPQYEKDYLHNHAIATKYESLNQKEKGAQLTPEQNRTPVQPVPQQQGRSDQPAHIPAQSDFYREYYGRADWLEAQNVVTAAATLDKGASSNLDRSTIVPELTDLEVQTINYVVNNLDDNRQQLITDYLKDSPDEHLQTIADMITVASEVKAAGQIPDAKEIELQLPVSYSLSPDSVATVVTYTQDETARANAATQLPAQQLADIRQESQAQAWRDMEREVIKDPATLLDAPAEVAYKSQDLIYGINQAADLQERARTAYHILNGHTAACVNKVENALQKEPSETQPFRSPEQQQTTRDLVKIALDPQMQAAKADLIKENASEYAFIQQTLTSEDKERAAQFKEYAANTREEYLQQFGNLDQDRDSLKGQQTIALSDTRAAGVSQSPMAAMDRYTATRDAIARETLGEKVQEMVQTRSLPEIPSEQLATLTVRDLVPADVRETAIESAREPAWLALQPTELQDAAAGRDVPEELVTLADVVMDHVATAQTIELSVDDKRAQLNAFIEEQVARIEAPVRDERAATAYQESFRDTITAIANDQNESPERIEAAAQLLETLDRGELDPATLVAQANTNQLGVDPGKIVVEANAAAADRAQTVREEPVFVTPEEQETLQQQVTAELNGPAADRYNQLRSELEETQIQFQASVGKIDERINELEIARADVELQNTLQNFEQISRPVAVEVNTYLKDTVRDEGLPALLEPTRFEEHVEQVATVIMDTARNNGINLGSTQESVQQVNEVANSLFNNLAMGIERANTQQTLSHQLTQQYGAAQQITEQSQLYAQLNPTNTMTPAGDHAVQGAFDDRDRQQRQREDGNKQPQGMQTPNLPDPSGRQQTAQEAAKSQDLTTASQANVSSTQAAAKAAEVGPSIEEAAAVLAL